MSRDGRERVQDILEALEAIARYVGGSLVEPSIEDPVVLDAVLFRLLVIGEAAKNIDDELRAAAPGVPWADYAGLRDLIAHQYFRVQKRIVENTVRSELSALKAAVETLLT